MSIEKGKGLLDEVTDIIRLKHYYIHTERSYWRRIVPGLDLIHKTLNTK